MYLDYVKETLDSSWIDRYVATNESRLLEYRPNRGSGPVFSVKKQSQHDLITITALSMLLCLYVNYSKYELHERPGGFN